MSAKDLLTETVFDEFRQTLQVEVPALPDNGDVVVVLAAAADKKDDGSVDFRSKEQIASVQWGIVLVRCIAQVSGEMPLLVLNGEDDTPLNSNGPTQLGAMLMIASEYRIPQRNIRAIDNVIEVDGKRIANTKTQFGVMKDSPELMALKNQIIVTSGYHVPRVARTVAEEYK